jgi:pimeloyl-ACP methyl ester carboxylesterase
VQINDQPPFEEAYFEGLYYKCYGLGRPIIALHGFGATSYSWRYLVPSLAPHYSIYLFDLKGHGKSDRPPDDRYSLQHQADLICKFIALHDLQHLTLIGHSMGGGVALLVAVKLLETDGDRLASLILIDTIAFPQKKPLFIRLITIPLLGRLLLTLVPATLSVKTVLRCAYFDKTRIEDDAIAEYAGNVQNAAGISAIIQVAKQIVPNNLDVVIPTYHKIKVPTLILWGCNDRIVSSGIGSKLNEILDRSTLSVIDDCGHIPHEERPTVSVPQVCNFLLEK